LKEVGMKAVVKRKRPLLSAKHRRERMDFALHTKTGLWRTGRRWFGQMRLKSIV
jgi:hypothetical protein